MDTDDVMFNFFFLFFPGGVWVWVWVMMGIVYNWLMMYEINEKQQQQHESCDLYIYIKTP